MKSALVYQTGGWLALLVLCHFAVDWIFQSHDEAMRKPKEWVVRARHCLIYTGPFAVLLCLTTWSPVAIVAAVGAVFMSHFVEDTYIPVLLWAKYVRRPPQMARRLVGEGSSWNIIENGVIRGFRTQKEVDVYGRLLDLRVNLSSAQRELDLDGFMTFVSEPLGKILMIVIDQIVHVLFLLPIAYMMASQP